MRQHKESIFFGLSTRQFFCAVVAVGIAVAVYLLLGPAIGKENASWLCGLAEVVLAYLIYSVFLSSGTPAADAALPTVTMVWHFIGQLIFNMLILTNLVRDADHIVGEALEMFDFFDEYCLK